MSGFTFQVPSLPAHLSHSTFVYTYQQTCRAFIFPGASGTRRPTQPGWRVILPHRPLGNPPARVAQLLCCALFCVLLVPAWGRQEQQSAGSLPPAETTATGSIQGVVMNRDKTVYEGARVELAVSGESAPRSIATDANGRFQFSGVPAGTFTIAVSAPGFAARTVSGTLQTGQSYEAPAIMLAVAATSSDVEVTANRQEIATEEVKLEEKQRVLGVIPNFYVVYDQHPVPLNPRQKFSLAWRTSIDPVSFLSAGFFAGIEQARNTFAGYGQGAQGYGKRYGADFADGFSSTMLGGALFPSIFRQDPRYYYKGKGSIASRTLYAIAMSFVCKGDNGHWQFNYSAVAGGVAAGEISNLYYPDSDQNHWDVVLDGTLIGMGESAVGNLFQEFLVRKLTPSARNRPTP